MSRRPTKPAPVVVKRAPEQRRKLPPELEAFARSDDEKLRIRRPRVDRGRVSDPREGYAVAGVANRDARAVYDVRAAELRRLWDDGAVDDDALLRLGQLLLDVLRLELWRARRVTSFAAFAEEVVGMPAGRAEALAEAASTRTGQAATPLTERSIALWLRTEAGLYEGDEGARARIRSTDSGAVLELSVGLADASIALAGVGARHLPLARARPGGDQAAFGRHEPRGLEQRGGERARADLHDEWTEQTSARDEQAPAGDDDSDDGPAHAGDSAAPGEGATSEESAALDERSAADDSDSPASGERERAAADSVPAARPVQSGARLLTRKPQGARGERVEEERAYTPRGPQTQTGRSDRRSAGEPHGRFPRAVDGEDAARFDRSGGGASDRPRFEANDAPPRFGRGENRDGRAGFERGGRGGARDGRGGFDRGEGRGGFDREARGGRGGFERRDGREGRGGFERRDGREGRGGFERAEARDGRAGFERGRDGRVGFDRGRGARGDFEGRAPHQGFDRDRGRERTGARRDDRGGFVSGAADTRRRGSEGPGRGEGKGRTYRQGGAGKGTPGAGKGSPGGKFRGPAGQGAGQGGRKQGGAGKGGHQSAQGKGFGARRPLAGAASGGPRSAGGRRREDDDVDDE